MAERRMFAKTVIDSDAFMDLPLTAHGLYTHLCMEADDDGFVNAPMKVVRSCKADRSDLDALIKSRFVLMFPSGVIVIKHWLINNYIQNDRYKKTVYREEYEQLEIKSNRSYTLKQPIPMEEMYTLDTSYTQVSRVENRLEENRLEDKSVVPVKTVTKRFTKPTITEIFEYCHERNNGVDPQRLFDYYESKGWLIGKTPMKDWKAAVRTWEKNGFNNGNGRETPEQEIARRTAQVERMYNPQ